MWWHAPQETARLHALVPAAAAADHDTSDAPEAELSAEGTSPLDRLHAAAERAWVQQSMQVCAMCECAEEGMETSEIAQPC